MSSFAGEIQENNVDIYESIGQENSPSNVMDKMYLSDGEIQVWHFLCIIETLDGTSALTGVVADMSTCEFSVSVHLGPSLM